MNKVKPTEMQAKAMQLIREGMKPGPAMIEAGYSEETARSPSRELLGKRGAELIIDQFTAEYLKLGIATPHLAKKAAQWLEAKKPFSSHTEPDREVDDWQTQIEAGKMIRKDMGLGQEDKKNEPTIGEVVVNIINYGTKPSV